MFLLCFVIEGVTSEITFELKIKALISQFYELKFSCQFTTSLRTKSAMVGKKKRTPIALHINKPLLY